MSVVPTYSLSVAAQAARTASRKIRRQIDSNVTPLRANDVKATGSGSRVGLSRNRILQTAITAVLLKSGVSLSRAAKAALEFTDSDNAGRLFPFGKTVLVLSPAGATVRNLDFSANIFDLLNDGVATIVELNAIVSKVDDVLNNSPSH